MGIGFDLRNANKNERHHDAQKKREKRERDEMHARIAKNDRVLTVGGVIGTIVSVKDTEVVLKVDESTNTKMTFLKSSVQRILSDE